MSLRNFRWSPSCACCDTSCIIYSDDFTIDDTTTVPNWTERSGDWEIISHELVENGTAGALIIANTSHSKLSWFTVVYPGAAGIISDVKYRLIANYLDDSTYFFAEFEYDSTVPSVTVRLYSRASGSNTLLREEVFEEDVFTSDMEPPEVYFSLCLDANGFTGTLHNRLTRFIAFVEYPTLHAGGYKVGLGNGTSTEIIYDNFNAVETTYFNEDCIPCFKICCARCDDWTWDERDGYWFWSGDLCLTLECTDCPELETTARLSPTAAPGGTSPIDIFWSGTTEGYFNGREVQLWCDANSPNLSCYRYVLVNLSAWTPGFGSGSCGVLDQDENPTSCTCPDDGEFELVWETETYNDEVGDCATWCDAGKLVTITITCCPPEGVPREIKLTQKSSTKTLMRSILEANKILNDYCKKCDQFPCLANTKCSHNGQLRLKVIECPMKKWQATDYNKF